MLELEEEQVLLFAAERKEFDVVIIVAQETQGLVTTNMPDSILPYVRLIVAAYYGDTGGFLTILGLEDRPSLIWTRLGAIALHVAFERLHPVIIKELVAALVPSMHVTAKATGPFIALLVEKTRR
jgi:hypothetical protein